MRARSFDEHEISEVGYVFDPVLRADHADYGEGNNISGVRISAGDSVIQHYGEKKMLHHETAPMVSNGLIGRRLLNVRETAQYLGLEVDTVYKKARLRDLPCVKVGRALRFDLKALERFVEQHTIKTID